MAKTNPFKILLMSRAKAEKFQEGSEAYSAAVTQYKSSKITLDELLLNGCVLSDELSLFNTEYFESLLRNRVVELKHVLDFYSQYDNLPQALESHSLFFHKCLTRDSCEHLVKNLRTKEDYLALCTKNDDLLSYLLKHNFAHFLYFVSKLQEFKIFREFLENEKLFKKIFENFSLERHEVAHLLTNINTLEEWDALCSNLTLIQFFIQTGFLYEKEAMFRLQTVLESENKRLNPHKSKEEWSKDLYADIDNILKKAIENLSADEAKNQVYEELRSLNALHKKFSRFKNFDLTTSEKFQLQNLVQFEEYAKNRLNYIFECEIEQTFNSFEDLQSYLTKKSMKKEVAV